MKFDVVVLSYRPTEIPALVRASESIGFDGFWVGETNADPFAALTLAAEHSTRVTIGSAIAVAFPRTPTVLAYTAHALADLSGGRFVLGLGPQVRAHNERRFGVKWERPVAKIEESIAVMRAVWDTWQTGAPLAHRGEFYRIDLMPPFFSPAPHAFGPIPVYLAAVNPHMLRLVGRSADGAFVHALHTTRYLREVVLPNVESGLAESGRTRKDVTINSAVFAVPMDDAAFARKAERHVRSQIAFYLSTPAYRVVAEQHGWEDIQYCLSRMARRGEWDTMADVLPESVTDEMIVRGSWAELPHMISERYHGLLDRVSYYLPFVPGEADNGWRQSIEAFASLRD